MSNTISSRSRVHVVAIDPRTGERLYMVRANTRRDSQGVLQIWPDWGNAEMSVPMDFQTACIVQRRMKDEHGQRVRFTLAATDNERFLDGD